MNGIHGTIPTEWQALTDLENLVVGSNTLTGTFPNWLNKLTKLSNINFSNNRMDGTIPSSVGDFAELVALALDRNLFTSMSGAFDTSVHAGLRNLTDLFLEDNQFTGTLTANFLRDSGKLKYLDVSDNRLAGSVPSHFFEMTDLIVLDLHDNDFTQLPQSFPMNEKLGLLALHKCNFESQPIPPSISNLKNLQHLDLSQNSFTGQIPSSIGTMTSLYYLFLAQNSFVGGNIPQWIANLTQLEELSLKTTQRSGPIPNFLGSLPSLMLLDLDDNELTGTIPASLGGLRNLVGLLLNRNNLVSTIPQSFSQLRNLRKLHELLFA